MLLDEKIQKTPNVNKRLSYLSDSIPETSICKLFNVVIEVVRFFLAQSNCLISNVISLTTSSLCSAFCLISLI